jgi:hypothetical protein
MRASDIVPAAKRGLGQTIKDIRKSKGLTLKEVQANVSSYYADERALRRVEAGERLPARTSLIPLLTRGLDIRSIGAVNAVLFRAGFDMVSTAEISQFQLEPDPPLEPVLVRWAPDDGKSAGIFVGTEPRCFIPWEQVKAEVETRLLPQLANIPVGCAVRTDTYKDHRDFVVRIADAVGTVIGSVWFGCDPYHGWRYDGLVRVGHSKSAGAAATIVWQVFQRYSDGSYRRIAAYD